MTESVVPHWSELDDDAKAAAVELATILPVPFHRMTPDGARIRVASVAREIPITDVHRVQRRTVPTRAAEVAVRIYRPRPESTTVAGPALLYVHGGGFTVGTLEGVDELCRALAVGADCTVVSVEYRLAPEFPFPAALEDCLDVYYWLVRHQDAGIDPHRVAVGGDSAGGNLAAAMCLALRDRDVPPPVLQVLAYPAVDCMFARHSWHHYADAPLLKTADAIWFWEQYLGRGPVAVNELAAPMRAESLAGLPTAHIVTATVDPTRDDAEAYAARLASAGVEVTLIRYPGVYHGFFTEVGVFARTGEAIDAASQALMRAFA